ncbi:glycoside hydrolase family 43 protein [Streptomyces acidiscabies]|uniref:Glycoside hydrolase family 43 protein n=1 Tax=Streptomyces acidiscabies TaxID=42234 RepID=A0AAP6EJ12_9ACTN|nr:glycoside hydrolase family 43 protein [Streptomyces acidiscabies]MBP5942333.1 family 43 glycosylhydrolase [Streptomyces sp. LBUM 1476]MBZ3913892.1 family 43 glycosylhydrolase [Streptomyces acidiscabies]MDX2964519.1 glycoside hydrolase family 43 protein [Streptomyces acidiscabies]MDX3022017.1 glycoside hydrolase family 43 protein [Streptomyces acidiscabies]MDX3793581.1 glycoside hydrolase family 43 protein [Streptomyces acidiscabies]
MTTEPMRLPGMPLHDPYVVADAKSRTYHLYTSNEPSVSGVDGAGTMVYRSADLRDWAPPVVVFLAAEQEGGWATDGAWAPEVHERAGRYYLFTTLHNEERRLAEGTYLRGTVTAVSDSLLGPFTLLDPSRPTTPEHLMALDGTLYVDPAGQPWMVYAHEWLQTVDGTMEAIRLTPDLSGTVGDAVHLFRGSDASWLNEQIPAGLPYRLPPYITDGPQLVRAPDGALLMLWSTYEKNVPGADGSLSGDYVQTYAVSESGDLTGPWTQRRPLVREDSGHGMLFRTFEGELMMILHRPFENARGKLYEMRLQGHELSVVRQRTDLDG